MSGFRNNVKPDHQSRWDRALEVIKSGDGTGAIYMYKSLANDGCAAALSQIGRIYEFGVAGVEQDFAEAAKWFKLSVETVDDLKSHLALVRIYLQAPKLDENRELVHYHLHLLARNEVTGGFYGLGLLYEHGLGVPVDKDAAAGWYKEAESRGHLLARLHRLRMLYQDQPIKYFFPTLLTSIRVAWLQMRQPLDERLALWDNVAESEIISS